MSERLEEIREQYKYRTGPNASNVKWLIEQAERVEELEMKYENTGSMFGRQNQRLLIEENTRLREALKFYADEDNYNLTAEAEKVALCEYIHMVDCDNGDKARKALEESK